jgi:hypothetical protein
MLPIPILKSASTIARLIRMRPPDFRPDVRHRGRVAWGVHPHEIFLWDADLDVLLSKRQRRFAHMHGPSASLVL